MEFKLHKIAICFFTLALLGSVMTYPHEESLKYVCPAGSTCADCPETWVFPEGEYSGSKNLDGTCDVTFHWEWDYQEAEPNPQLVFICTYSNGQSCNVPGLENQCGSCQNFTLTSITGSLNPTVHYTDSCGNSADYLVGDACDGHTSPPDISSTSSAPASSNPTSQISTSTSKPITTTPGEVYCPNKTECSGCPLDFDQTVFELQGSLNPRGLCDIEVTWSFDYTPELVDNPNLNFFCIYGANGEYCEESPKSVCGSCKKVEFSNVDLSLNPYVDYLDTCSNLKQFYIGHDCNQITLPPQSTPPPDTGTTIDSLPGFCPELNQCIGCPIPVVPPKITQKGTLISPNNCTVELTWQWQYTEDDPNMRMVFLCLYESGYHCQPLLEDVCASCEKFTIYNVDPSMNPFLDYSDTCGTNQHLIPLTKDCY